MFLFTLAVFIMLLCLHILTLNMYSGKQNLYSISRRTKLSYFLLLLYFFVLFLMNVISLQHNWQYKVSPTRRRKNKCSYSDSSPGIFVLFLLGYLYSVHSYSVYSDTVTVNTWSYYDFCFCCFCTFSHVSDLYCKFFNFPPPPQVPGIFWRL